tara:strand:- start:1150 stop:2331 length:1182 start_codon:yes stop_codon:yes gene_type:complete
MKKLILTSIVWLSLSVVNIVFGQNYTLIDSLPLFDDSRYFTFINTQNYKNDTIMAFSYPKLDLSFINGKGKFLSKITQKGEGPGLLGTAAFIDVAIGQDRDIYVMSIDNTFTLFVYSPQGKYKGQVRLFNSLTGASAQAFYSSFNVVNDVQRKGHIILTMSIGSTMYSPFSEEFYLKGSQIAQFRINKQTLKVESTEKKVLLRNEPEIKEALTKNSMSWYRATALFDFNKDEFYKATMYSRKIDVYDRSFNKIREIELTKLPRLRNNFSIKFSPKRSTDIMARTTRDQKLQYENVSIWNVQSKGDILLVQLNQPVEAGKHKVPTFKEMQDGWSASYPSLVIVKNLKTNIEKLFSLDPRFQGKITLVDSEHFLIQGSPSPDVEETYLYKFRIGL